FLGLTQINGVAVSFGKWAIEGSWNAMLLMLVGATIVCVWCANSLALTRHMTKLTIIVCAIVFAQCLILLTTSNYQAPFLYFNF
ncbi:hypothetical protein, partial [uncultured Helicobacter sp.]|uniref:hypothetical protein n=1 Tax=uncultured Helicobacter sp. TaxID=175537 RepID=UPI00374F9252